MSDLEAHIEERLERISELANIGQQEATLLERAEFYRLEREIAGYCELLSIQLGNGTPF